MRKIPISGGPHTGKTTLIKALRIEFPDAYFVDEPAERVIADELRKEQENKDYVGIVPMRNYSAFSPLVISESLILEAAVPADAELVFQDRSLIDNIGYCVLNNYRSQLPALKRYIDAAKYSFALLCEPVGDYTATEIRHETLEQALETHHHLVEAYDNSGIPVVHLPAVPVPERIALVYQAIEQLR